MPLEYPFGPLPSGKGRTAVGRCVGDGSFEAFVTLDQNPTGVGQTLLTTTQVPLIRIATITVVPFSSP